MKRTFTALLLASGAAAFSPSSAQTESPAAQPEQITAGKLRVLFCDNSQNPVVFTINLLASKADLQAPPKTETVASLMNVMRDTSLMWGTVMEPQLQIIAKGHGGTREQTNAQLHDLQSPLMRDIQRILTDGMNRVIAKNNAQNVIGYQFTRPSLSTLSEDRRGCGASLQIA